MAGLPALVVDSEMLVRAWARTIDLAEVAYPGSDPTGRVFFGVPKDPLYPLVVLRQISAPPDPNLPTITARISFEVWADPATGGKGRASRIATRIAAEANVVTAWTSIVHGGVIDGASITAGPLWRPDTEAHRARYVVDASFSIRPLT